MKHSVLPQEVQELLSELKLVNYKNHSGHEGMQGINAVLVYKGRKIAELYDDAYGGEIEVRTIGKVVEIEGKWQSDEDLKKNRELLKELEDRVKALPERDNRYHPGETVPWNLDLIISELETEVAIKKDEKKGIVLFDDNHGHSILGWKVSIPAMIKKYGKDKIVGELNKDVVKLKTDGEIILNGEYLQSLGVVL